MSKNASALSLNLDSDTMCFFIDESGESSLAGTHNAFCLAGCAVHSTQLPFLERKWKLLMLQIFGKSTHIFHASDDISKNLSKNNQQKIFDFCKKNYFARFGVGYHKNSDITEYRGNSYQICTSLLIQPCFIKILKNYPIFKISPMSGVRHPTNNIYLPSGKLPFRKIVIIIEECDRDRDIITLSYSNFSYMLNGVEIKPEINFMPKNVAHPCLQIADLIANSSRREILRHYNGDTNDQGHDFKEIFNDCIPDVIKYFSSIETLSVNDNTNSEKP